MTLTGDVTACYSLTDIIPRQFKRFVIHIRFDSLLFTTMYFHIITKNSDKNIENKKSDKKTHLYVTNIHQVAVFNNNRQRIYKNHQ